MGKLDLSDEVIVGVEKMRIADDIVCYSTAISDCVKEPNSLMALTLFKGNRPVQPVQRPDCVHFNDQCMWKRHVLDHGITFAVSDAKHRTAEECLSLQRGDHSIWESFSLGHCTEAAQGGKRARWRREQTRSWRTQCLKRVRRLISS